MSYQPQYLSLGDIPVQIPDDYSEEQKREALQVAEAEAELDLNDGASLNELPASIMPKIEIAMKQKATGELTSGAEAPDDVTLGDLSNDGTDKRDYSEMFDSNYQTIIAKIRNSDVLDDTRDDSAYTYTTHQTRSY